MSGKTKFIAFILLGLGLLFLGLALLTGQQGQTQREVIQQELERATVVVATKKIPFDTVITPDMLRVDKVPIAPTGSYQSVTDLEGRKPVYTIEAGVPITKQFFEPGAVASQLRDGFRAFAMSLDENNVSTAKIKAGDFVDVFSIFRAKDKEVDQTISRLILPKLRVLSVGEQLVNSPEAAKEQKAEGNSNAARQKRNDRAVMVEVATEEVNNLALAQAQGELFVVIRSPDDETMPDTSLYPKADTVLKPIPPKAPPKGAPGSAPSTPEPAPELSAATKAYAGTAIRDVVVPGSAKNPNVIRELQPKPVSTRPAEPREETTEIIRAGEISKEKAR